MRLTTCERRLGWMNFSAIRLPAWRSIPSWAVRELIPHESYRLVYEIERETVWVLALVHTARQWPPV